jgi:hypothetical protein
MTTAIIFCFTLTEYDPCNLPALLQSAAQAIGQQDSVTRAGLKDEVQTDLDTGSTEVEYIAVFDKQVHMKTTVSKMVEKMKAWAIENRVSVSLSEDLKKT